MAKEQFARTAAMIGDDAVEKLSQCHVAVCGLGGVGSYTAEALARSGVGGFTIIDNDTVDPTNINRQIYALGSTVGMLKTDVAAARIQDINPDAKVKRYPVLLGREPEPEMFKDCDVIIDAIDTVSAKVSLAVMAEKLNIPLLSAMGCGNKKRPELLQLADIYETSICPLCRVMRHELRAAGVKKLRVVYSTEPPYQLVNSRTPSSMMFVPASAGILLAREAVEILLSENENEQ